MIFLSDALPVPTASLPHPLYNGDSSLEEEPPLNTGYFSSGSSKLSSPPADYPPEGNAIGSLRMDGNNVRFDGNTDRRLRTAEADSVISLGTEGDDAMTEGNTVMTESKTSLEDGEDESDAAGSAINDVLNVINSEQRQRGDSSFESELRVSESSSTGASFLHATVGGSDDPQEGTGAPGTRTPTSDIQSLYHLPEARQQKDIKQVCKQKDV